MLRCLCDPGLNLIKVTISHIHAIYKWRVFKNIRQNSTHEKLYHKNIWPASMKIGVKYYGIDTLQ